MKEQEEPTPSDPVLHFFNQIANLLETIQMKQSQPVKELPADIEARLSLLENLVKLFHDANTDLQRKAGLDEERLKQMTSALPPKERRVLEYSERIKGELDKMQRENAAKGSIEKKGKKQKAKDAGKERRKKFDQLGHRKDWKPL